MVFCRAWLRSRWTLARSGSDPTAVLCLSSWIMVVLLSRELNSRTYACHCSEGRLRTSVGLETCGAANDHCQCHQQGFTGTVVFRSSPFPSSAQPSAPSSSRATPRNPTPTPPRTRTSRTRPRRPSSSPHLPTNPGIPRPPRTRPRPSHTPHLTPTPRPRRRSRSSSSPPPLFLLRPPHRLLPPPRLLRSSPILFLPPPQLLVLDLLEVSARTAPAGVQDETLVVLCLGQDTSPGRE